jgi:hypothetical protein
MPDEKTGRTSFSYRLPGGFCATYSGSAKPLWLWIASTWPAGLALWRIWMREAVNQIMAGKMPWPRHVSVSVAAHLGKVFDFLAASGENQHDH